MKKLSLLIVSFVSTVAACGYAPSPKSGAQACDLNGSHPCPDGYYCAAVDSMCWTKGSGPGGGTSGAPAKDSSGAGGTAGTSASQGTGSGGSRAASGADPCNFDAWIASENDWEIPIPTTCSSSFAGTATATANLPTTLAPGAPTSLTVTFSPNTLTSVNGVSCSPAFPGMVDKAYPSSCQQYFLCGCCRYTIYLGGKNWTVESIGNGSPGYPCSNNRGDNYSF
jgi:hypothetical protein